MKTLASELVQIAKGEVGVEEINGTNRGVRVDEYKAATNLPPHESWPWCSAFVCWCVREAAKSSGVKFTEAFTRPVTAAAWGLESWSMKQDRSTWTRKPSGLDIIAGDIVVFNFSHCAIAISEPDEEGNFRTIEGNTDGQGSREGGAVLKKVRRTSQVRSRIRFRV